MITLIFVCVCGFFFRVQASSMQKHTHFLEYVKERTIISDDHQFENSARTMGFIKRLKSEMETDSTDYFFHPGSLSGQQIKFQHALQDLCRQNKMCVNLSLSLQMLGQTGIMPFSRPGYKMLDLNENGFASVL